MTSAPDDPPATTAAAGRSDAEGRRAGDRLVKVPAQRGAVPYRWVPEQPLGSS
jgi:hypothetical protein